MRIAPVLRRDALIDVAHVPIALDGSLELRRLRAFEVDLLQDFDWIRSRLIRRGEVAGKLVMPADEGGRSQEDGDSREARMDLAHRLTSDRYG